MSDMDNCDTCKNYAPLKEPWKVSEECCVYGFCFKNYDAMMSTYPVYIPDGACKEHARAIETSQITERKSK